MINLAFKDMPNEQTKAQVFQSFFPGSKLYMYIVHVHVHVHICILVIVKWLAIT